MAWNGSDQGKVKEKVERRGRGQEGGGQYHHSTLNTPRSSLKHGIIGGLVVVLLGCAGVWWFVGRGGGQEADRPTNSVGSRVPRDRIAEVEPQIATNAPLVGADPRAARDAKSSTSNPLSKSANTQQYAFSEPPRPNLPVPPKPIQNSVFDSVTDQLLSMAINTQGEIPPLPITPDMEIEFLESLKKPIVINDDDADDVKRSKEAVMAARESMNEMLKLGKSFQDILEAHCEQANFNTEIRTKAVVDAQELMDAGDIEGARNYVEKMNEALEKIGVQQIEMPLSHEERRILAIERAQQRKLQKENQQ